MQGQVLRGDASGGVVLGDDGFRYAFEASDWKGAAAATAGDRVDFIAGDGAAKEVYILPPRPSAWPAPSAQPASEGSSVLLGVLGIGCLVLSFVVPLIPLLGALVLGLVGASSAKRYGNGTGLVVCRISWIGAVILALIGVGLLVWAWIYAWPLFWAIYSVFLAGLENGMVV